MSSEGIKYKSLGFLIGIFVLSDLLTNISIMYFGGTLSRLAGIVKLIFEFIMVYSILKNYKNIHRPTLILSLILFTGFLITSVFNLFSKANYFDALLVNIYYFNRYIYVLIFIVFFKIINKDYYFFNKLIGLFKKVLYLNSVLILIGFFTKIELFRSYPYTQRFGYDGLFSKDGEAVYYYIFFLSILYYEYVVEKNNRNLLKIVVVALISLLVGKKAILLFLFLLLMAHVIITLKKVKFLLFLFLPTVAGLIIFKENLLKLSFSMFPFWERSFKAYGFLGTITSTRSKLAANFIEYVQSQWGIINYFFGVGEYEKYKVEFEAVDVFLFFGLTGLVVFFFIFKMHFYNQKSLLSNSLMICVLITSFFSGALFLSVTCMMMFYITFQWIYYKELNNTEK